VLAGVTAASATAAVARLVGFWDADSRAATRARIAAVLRGVLHQRLVPAQGGKKGMTVEAEIVPGGAAAATR